MRRALGLWLLAVSVACSSGPDVVPDSDGGGSGGGAGRAPEPTAGQMSSGAAGSGGIAGSDDWPAVAGTGGRPDTAGTDAGGASSGAGTGGSAGGSDDGGDGGRAEAGAAGSTSEDGGEGGTGGAGGTSGGTSGGGSGGSAGSGGAPVDSCAGHSRWSATDRWTDYEVDERRVFGGVLWRCQTPAQCPTYPGHSVSPGWFKVSDCLGGPTNETAKCQCSSGTCCDGCYLRPRSHLCGEFVRTAQCLGTVVNQCGGATETIDKDWWNLFCNGDEAAACTRWGAHTKFTNGACPTSTGCMEQGDQASCTACGG